MSPDYWEDNLTMPRLKAQLAELRENPPPEFFLSVYFQAREWWSPGSSDTIAPDATQEEPEIPAAQLPEFEP